MHSVGGVFLVTKSLGNCETKEILKVDPIASDL